jgi:hypothetical protein
MVCAWIQFPKTFEDYNKTLSKSVRQNFRTAVNRASRDELLFSHEMVFEFDESLLKKMSEIRNRRQGLKAIKMHARAPKDFKSRIRRAMISAYQWMTQMISGRHDVIRENAYPWALLVKSGDRIAGYFWGIRDQSGEGLYVILSAIEPDFERYSLVKTALYLQIRENYETGSAPKYIDFTRGADAYKYDLGATNRAAWRMVDFSVQ